MFNNENFSIGFFNIAPAIYFSMLGRVWWYSRDSINKNVLPTYFQYNRKFPPLSLEPEGVLSSLLIQNSGHCCAYRLQAPPCCQSGSRQKCHYSWSNPASKNFNFCETQDPFEIHNFPVDYLTIFLCWILSINLIVSVFQISIIQTIVKDWLFPRSFIHTMLRAGINLATYGLREKLLDLSPREVR